jgi:hypothetical protein
MLLRICALAMVPLALLLETTNAWAAAQRTFVASYGTDSAPCAINQPCRSFGAAVAKAAAGGEVIVLDSAGYGPVTIDKPVSLIAPPGIYAGISVTTGQNGIVVNASGATVVLRGLSINGQGGSIGIDLVQAAKVRVEGCVVSNMASTGIQHSAANAELIVLDTVVRDNSGAGISVNVDASVLLDGVRVEHNVSDGLNVTAVSTLAVAVVRNSVLSYNGQAGIAALRSASPAKTEIALEASVIAGNAYDGVFVGGIADGQSYAAIARTTIARNGLSGVSVYAPGASGTFTNAELVENQFLNNGTNAVKVDGSHAGSFLSRNHFAGGLTASFQTVNSAAQFTYTDNTGNNGYVGTAPFALSRF